MTGHAGTTPASRWALPRVLAGLLCTVSYWHAATAAPAEVNTEVGIGSETQSSPLFRLSSLGTPIYLGGLQRLRSEHLTASTSMNWLSEPSKAVHVSMAASAMVKHAPARSDFDLTLLTVQPTLHWALAGLSLGTGPNWQGIGVSGRHFRATPGWQVSMSLPQDENLLTLLMERGRYRHTSEWQDLDAHATTALLQWQRTFKGGSVETAQLTLHAGQESNLHGLAELSQHSRALQWGADGQLAGLNWSFLGSWQRSRFRASVFEGEAPRRDRSWTLDMAITKPLDSRHALKFSFSHSRNHSSVPLYDQRYRQLSCSVTSRW